MREEDEKTRWRSLSVVLFTLCVQPSIFFDSFSVYFRLPGAQLSSMVAGGKILKIEK